MFQGARVVFPEEAKTKGLPFFTSDSASKSEDGYGAVLHQGGKEFMCLK